MSRSSARVQRVIWNVVLVVVAVLCGNTRGQPSAPVSKRDSDSNGGSDSGGVQINQIDLLSGTPTLLVAIAAFIQILPLPVDVFKPRLARFLDWLCLGVERDFSSLVCTCRGQCLGCKYQPTEYWVGRWLNISLGKAEPIECTSPDVLSMDDLAQIIQTDGNGDVLLRLARLARYP
ncbi:hypothetical protein GGF46_003301 [Coemansia sp. RSA 552]|nr:hypothetical protein GGF46_003301 [Coemansia sp. RSA 552]